MKLGQWQHSLTLTTTTTLHIIATAVVLYLDWVLLLSLTHIVQLTVLICVSVTLIVILILTSSLTTSLLVLAAMGADMSYELLWLGSTAIFTNGKWRCKQQRGDLQQQINIIIFST